MCVITTSAALVATTVASLVMGAISTGIGMYSSYQQGKQQQNYYNYQAELDRQNAIRAKQNAASELQGGIEEARLQRIKTMQQVGSQQTAMAANGIDVTSGSALDVIEDTQAMGELDALNIMRNAQVSSDNYLLQSNSFESQAYLNSIAGKNAYKNGIYGTIGSFASGVGNTVQGLGNLDKVSDYWKRLKKTGNTL